MLFTMFNIIKRYNAWLLILMFVVWACQKEDPIYVDDARVNFWVLQDTIANTGSKVYNTGFTFAKGPDSKMQDTIRIRVRVMGPIVGVDRHFKAEAITGTDALAPTDYEILDGLVEAHAYIGYLPIVLKRSAALKTTSKKIVVKIAPNAEFKPGVQEDQQFQVLFNDGLVQPDNWDVLSTYFGSYSEVKYKFIIQVLGRSEFPVATGAYREGQLTHYQMLDLKNLLFDALEEHNRNSQTPLEDEDGYIVTFP
jgi:hypothetical protein